MLARLNQGRQNEKQAQISMGISLARLPTPFPAIVWKDKNCSLSAVGNKTKPLSG
jgi:hypothetical protein